MIQLCIHPEVSKKEDIQMVKTTVHAEIKV